MGLAAEEANLILEEAASLNPASLFTWESQYTSKRSAIVQYLLAINMQRYLQQIPIRDTGSRATKTLKTRSGAGVFLFWTQQQNDKLNKHIRCTNVIYANLIARL